MNDHNNIKIGSSDTKLSLVFVHGYPGGSSQWIDQKEFFSRYFNILTPELPGFGDSYHSVAPESITGFAESVLGQLEKSGKQKFHLVGHSMGGMIAQEMVKLSPDQVDRLVLYGTGANGLMPGRFETIDDSKNKIKQQGVEKTARQIAANWFVKREAASEYETIVRLAILATSQAALAGLTAMENWSGAAVLDNINSPTLVLWGDRDSAYPWSQPQQLWKTIKSAQLAVVPNCSHAVHAEKPHLFNPILLDFLLAGG